MERERQRTALLSGRAIDPGSPATRCTDFCRESRAKDWMRWDENGVRSRRGAYRAVFGESGRTAGRFEMGRGARGSGTFADAARSTRALVPGKSRGRRQRAADRRDGSAGNCAEGVIDRTFVDENGVRWIIDYKTSEPRAKPGEFPGSGKRTLSGATGALCAVDGADAMIVPSGWACISRCLGNGANGARAVVLRQQALLFEL